MEYVSIHAPARGATWMRYALKTPRSRFNPRAREGRDCGAGSIQMDKKGFNPRAREGRDWRG